MDDFILWGHDKSGLKPVLAQVADYLSERLRLDLHAKQQLNRSRSGLPFLGYRVFPRSIRLSASTRKRMVRRLKQYETAVNENSITETELIRRMESLAAVARAGNGAGFMGRMMTRFTGVSTGLEPGDARRLVHE